MEFFQFLFTFAILYYILYHVFKLRPNRSGFACGILGFNGALPADETKVKWLAAMNESRGSQSTGFFTVSTNKEKTETLIKDVDKATKFIKRADVTAAIKGANVVIGHTRAASWGAVNKDNAHPFEKKAKTRVVGVHNGFVIQEVAKEKWIGENKLFNKDFDVDSEIIFALLSEYDGDPNILSEIEGAITIAYTVPDKYPGIVHLYARKARTLHLARAKEGIYFSSEEEPLELIGCQEILQVSDNTLVLLKDGEIMDIKQLDPPKIKSITLNTKRHEWADKATKSELESYESTKSQIKTTPNQCEIDYSPYRGKTGRYPAGPTVHKTNNYTPTRHENIENIRGMLVKEILEDMALYVSKPIPEFSLQDSFTSTDTDCCIIVLELQDSVTKKGLPGWVVFNKNNPDNAGVTMLNGVVPLKFAPTYCGVEQTLVMKDPVDGETIFTFTIKPENGRILEVVLQLPFQQKDTQVENGENTNSGVNDQLWEKLDKLATEGCVVLPNTLELLSGGRGSEDENPRLLSEEEKHVHFGYKETQVSGEEGRSTTEGDNILRIGKSTQRDVFVPWTSLGLGIIEAATIIKKENEIFALDKKIKSLVHTEEYRYCIKTIAMALPGIVNVAKVTHDAAVLKLHFFEHKNASFSVLRYAAFLLERQHNHYLLPPKTLAGITTKEKDSIIDFVTNIAVGKLPNPESKKKLTLSQMSPLEWHNQPNVKVDAKLQSLIDRLN